MRTVKIWQRKTIYDDGQRIIEHCGEEQSKRTRLLISQICRCWLQIHSSLVKFCSTLDLKGYFLLRVLPESVFISSSFYIDPHESILAPPVGRVDKNIGTKKWEYARKAKKRNKKIYCLKSIKEKRKYSSPGKGKVLRFWGETHKE